LKSSWKRLSEGRGKNMLLLECGSDFYFFNEEDLVYIHGIDWKFYQGDAQLNSETLEGKNWNKLYGFVYLKLKHLDLTKQLVVAKFDRSMSIEEIREKMEERENSIKYQLGTVAKNIKLKEEN